MTRGALASECGSSFYKKPQLFNQRAFDFSHSLHPTTAFSKATGQQNRTFVDFMRALWVFKKMYVHMS